jgi:hypothetical protein
MSNMTSSFREKPAVIRRLMLAVLVLSMLCLAPPIGRANGASRAPKGRLPKGVIVGFNAKGTVDSPNQIASVDKVFAAFPPATVSKWVIRITGGTRSQSDYPSSWSDAQLDGCISLQKKYGFKYVYVVNGNDSPESQAAFIARWRDRGAQFEFIEMMNEYYLARYRTGDTAFDEVTKVVTAESYVNEILPTYLPVIEKAGLPIYVILAPSKQEGSSASLASWNDIVVAALNGPLTSKRLGVVVHLYKKPNQTLGYNQIAKLRARLPKGTKIALTEVGVTDAPTAEAQALETTKHLVALAAQLKPGDYLFDQILYKDDKNGFEGTIGPDGITVKGKAVLDLYLLPRS